MPRPRLLLALFLVLGCGGEVDVRGGDASTPDVDGATAPSDAGGSGEGGSDAAPSLDAGDLDAASPLPDPDAGTAPEPCATRITYGAAWMHGPERTTQYDDVNGRVTWDGVCHFDGTNSYAELSNGWKPFFRGRSSCVIALDVRGDCASPPPDGCRTRVTYGASWQAPAGHPNRYDDVRGVVTWDGECNAAGSNSAALLSNGWRPHFNGSNSCSMGFRHEQCGGLYSNPVFPTGCADPGVVKDGNRYVMVCTSGNDAAAFPIRTSRDLVHWQNRGRAFPAGTRPSWASGDFWAPEIHRVGSRWIIYFSARQHNGRFAIGAGIADDVLGPYTDLGRPLVQDPNPGIIDAHHFEAPDGQHYLSWKVDGNDVGRPTPIRIQRIADDGITLQGSPVTILTNDRSWEGGLVEGQWMIHRGGYYYLFYSANGYATTRYAVGVARATSPLGPFTKHGPPILTSNRDWSGPGHGSVVRGPSGDWVHVYHSWVAGQIGAAPGRVVLVDRITWSDGWPRMHSAPSPRSRSQPMP